jgi:hypothetical protein
MRFIKTIPHKVLGISLYSINRKYLIKFEKSDYEIGFKISEEEVANLVELENKISSPEFIHKILDNFKMLNISCQEFLSDNF